MRFFEKTLPELFGTFNFTGLFSIEKVNFENSHIEGPFCMGLGSKEENVFTMGSDTLKCN